VDPHRQTNAFEEHAYADELQNQDDVYWAKHSERLTRGRSILSFDVVLVVIVVSVLSVFCI
jgi:hypothetical protein